ncbi:hypothetical protein PSS2_gp006 [Cyanophage PSS2]|uniref:hypothetical protein n=1 Tax=Cyanophage PSS2 TaxID=658401 RepID=UPI0001B03FDC|nr:hypothetical protein PSS2_gp006 [Cyanophage PSS2]ACT65568.1 hypothetical protein [Cyanophage PSS2]
MQTLIKDVIEAHESAEDAILALERDGLANALTIVGPMQMIRRLPMDSPMRNLQVFQMSCLYHEREATMRQVIEFLDEEMRAGVRTASSIKAGVVKVANSALKSRADMAKLRRGNTGTRVSKTDLYAENARLRGQLDKFEAFFSDVKSETGLKTDDEVIALFYGAKTND